MRVEHEASKVAPSLLAQVEEQLVEVELEAAEIKKETAALEERWESISARWDRLVVRSAQAGLAIQLITLVVVATVFAGTAKEARGVHLDYYMAVASIAPVLLVAGLAELVVLRLRGGVWTALTFAIPSSAATFASLHVLATHNSTPATSSLTGWGLNTTFIFLLLYFVMHSVVGPPRSS